MKNIIKLIFTPFIALGMKIVFPKFKNTSYYRLSVLHMGIKQKIVGRNKSVPWPVHPTSIVISSEKINPGSKAPGFSLSCYIDGRNGIEIAENVWIGPRVSIISQNHDINNYFEYLKSKPIKIGKNSLLTCNCVILPGVELGEHTVVAANAVVRDSFPEGNQLLAGNPAVIVKKLEQYQERGN